MTQTAQRTTKSRKEILTTQEITSWVVTSLKMPLFDFFVDIFATLFDPKKRIFLGYIFLSVLISFAYLIFAKKQSLQHTLNEVFSKSVLLSRSAKRDYIMFVINRSITIFVSPLLLTKLAIATVIFYYLHKLTWLTKGMLDTYNPVLIAFLFTFFIFILDDLTKYIVHRLMHRVPILWALHKVHHSAETLNPITIYRTHPLEGIVFTLRASFTQGIAISTFIFLFGNKVDLLTILGANIFIFTFNVAGSNLRHSHIYIRYWRWLEFFLISPAQHQIHHSLDEKHYDKNFGATLSIWDWIGGSLHHSEERRPDKLGLSKNEFMENPSTTYMYIGPIIEIVSISLSKLKAAFRIFQKLVWWRDTKQYSLFRKMR